MHPPEVVVPAVGQLDIWKTFFDPLEDVGGLIECEVPGGRSLHAFLYYACSNTTYAIRVAKLEKTKGNSTLQVFGPKCKQYGRLYIEHKFTKDDTRLLSLAESQQLKQALKKRLRKTDPEWEKPGLCEAREFFRVLGLTF